MVHLLLPVFSFFAASHVTLAQTVQEGPAGNVYVEVSTVTTLAPIVTEYVTVGAVAIPTPVSSAPVPAASSSPPQASSSPPLSVSVQAHTGAKQSQGDQICINFSGGNFHWKNVPEWGATSGDASNASQCFNRVQGGAMFICEGPCPGANDASLAKYTKLECNFGAGLYDNCDISLVDGYSLPLQCDIPGAWPVERIGGLKDLTELLPCPANAAAEDHTCGNTLGYIRDSNPDAREHPPIDQFFLNANGGPGGNYCVWQVCSNKSDIFFTGTPTITCQVGTRSRKRDVDARLLDGPVKHRRYIGGVHTHGNAHVRALKHVLA